MRMRLDSSASMVARMAGIDRVRHRAHCLGLRIRLTQPADQLNIDLGNAADPHAVREHGVEAARGFQAACGCDPFELNSDVHACGRRWLNYCKLLVAAKAKVALL